MAKGMVWMWEYSVKETDAKGKEVQVSRMSLKPKENAKRVRVRYIGPKGNPSWDDN